MLIGLSKVNSRILILAIYPIKISINIPINNKEYKNYSNYFFNKINFFSIH